MRFTQAELQQFRDRIVPDLLPDPLRLLFIGINPGLWSAATGAHFARRGNRFYPALHRAGLTRHLIDASDGYKAEDLADAVEAAVPGGAPPYAAKPHGGSCARGRGVPSPGVARCPRVRRRGATVQTRRGPHAANRFAPTTQATTPAATATTPQPTGSPSSAAASAKPRKGCKSCN